MHFAVVMSGGRGKRFWPLSRRARPKQLINISGAKTLLELTVERLIPIFEPGNILVVTQAEQYEETGRILSRFDGVRILTEPVGKNTAPCVAYAASYVRATAGEGILVFLPADHFIRNEDTFRSLLSAGMDFVERTGALLTIGIAPGNPATGFGYVKRGKKVEGAGGFEFFQVERFTEKPSLERAREYVHSGEYMWNAGIFVFRASAVLNEIKNHLPEMAAEFEKCAESFNTPDEGKCLNECYRRVEDISIDYGVMEKTQAACVVPADIGWDDVGNWDSFAKYISKDEAGNSVHGRHVVLGSQNCIVYSDRQVVAAIGLTGIAVIATDDAVLVMKREKGEEVKKIVDLLEEKGLTDLL